MLLLPRTAAAVPNMIFLCFDSLFFPLMEEVLLVLAGAEPVLGYPFFLFFCCCIVRRISRGARQRYYHHHFRCTEEVAFVPPSPSWILLRDVLFLS